MRHETRLGCASDLKPQIAERGMIVWSPPQRPVIFALVVAYPQVIDACNTRPHQPVLVELPVLVAVAAIPVAAVVVPLIGEAHRNAILAKRPHLLDQPVV